MRRLVGASFVVAAVAIAAPAAQDVPPLAQRCEAVAWGRPPMKEVLLEEDLVPAGLRAIAKELVAAGPGSLASVEESLPHSRNLRRIAAKVVAEWPGDRSRALLLRLLSDPDEPTAESAAFHLGIVGGKEVVPALLKAAADGFPMLRHNALNSLGWLGRADEALEVGKAGLTHWESSVRHSAAQLLEKVEGSGSIRDALEALRRHALKEPEPGARKASERAIRILQAKQS
ncbi:MAG: HEAT repeat domain-containing protein [Planctomycetales bacterium]|nr:HEAT repeat domain-containing protein [Planctomycetales bacterium]